KMKLNMASGHNYDLCFTGYVNNYSDAVTNGGLLDITEKIDKISGLKELLPDYAWEAAEIDGKIYAIPNLQIMATANSLFVRKDMAEKYNLDIASVKTIDDIEPFLEKVKNGEPNLYPYRPNFGVIPWYITEYDSVVSNIVLKKGSTSTNDLAIIQTTPEYEKGAKKLWDWYQKGYIRKDVLSIGDDSTDYKNGKYAVTNEFWKPGAETAISLAAGSEVVAIPLEKPYMSKSKATATMFAIGMNSRYPDKALEFVKLINSNKELYNLISFGVKDTDYTFNDEGKVVLSKNSGYNQLGNAWKFGNTFNALVLEGQPSDIWEQTKKTNIEADKSTMLGFMFDKSKVKSKLSNLGSLTSEYEFINRGVKDPDTYLDDYIRKLKEAGIEEIYQESKTQLDEYFASSTK
ncbi:MAG: ABC transporter substrate-binding protein, partial [Oscillospiraceae bacterium]